MSGRVFLHGGARFICRLYDGAKMIHPIEQKGDAYTAKAEGVGDLSRILDGYAHCQQLHSAAYVVYPWKTRTPSRRLRLQPDKREDHRGAGLHLPALCRIGRLCRCSGRRLLMRRGVARIQKQEEQEQQEGGQFFHGGFPLFRHDRIFFIINRFGL